MRPAFIGIVLVLRVRSERMTRMERRPEGTLKSVARTWKAPRHGADGRAMNVGDGNLGHLSMTKALP